MKPVLIKGLHPIRIMDVKKYGLKAAVRCSMGEQFMVNLSEVTSKRLVSLDDDQQAQKKASIENIASGCARATLTPADQEGVDVLCYYYPVDDDKGIKRLLIDIAADEIGPRLSSLIYAFNEQRQFLHENFPELKGKIKSTADLQGSNAIVTKQQREVCVRRFLEMQSVQNLLPHANMDGPDIMPVSREFIEDHRSAEQEFLNLHSVALMATNGKEICTGYIGKKKELSFVHVGDVRIYYPDESSDYFITITDTGSKGSNRFDMRVVESGEEVCQIVRERHPKMGAVKLDQSRKDIKSQYMVPSFTKRVGAAVNKITHNKSTLEELKGVCKEQGITGYSNKDRDQLLEMIAEYQTDAFGDKRDLQGNYMVVQNSKIKGNDCPQIIGRITTHKAFLADRECIVDESKLDVGYEIWDTLNPFESGFKHVNDDTDDSHVLRRAETT